MGWFLHITLLFALGAALFARRRELGRMAGGRAERRKARERGSDRARLQYPHVDLSRCIGCGICVEACPEEGVLDLLHGQAVVVHGARCVGHGLCAAECPVGAIAVTLGDLEKRRDIPALDASFESPNTPGLFLAGEVTGFALVRTAIAHGTAVAAEVARRVRENGTAGTGAEENGDLLDLCIVGAGPAGLACSLEAKRRGLSFVTLEQEELGGTVAKYPRRKLVLTQPVDLPLHGRLKRTSYSKEELMDLWTGVAEKQQLPILTGETFVGLERFGPGHFQIRTNTGVYHARNVCLSLGRRGSPRKLGVPGEELPHVAYSLLDAKSYQGRRILVVGGGDSAVEAALGLGEQPGNEVVLSYRKHAFNRIKARNEARLMEALQGGRLKVLYGSQVRAITPDEVRLEVADDGGTREERLPTDEVFVFAGGTPPFKLLEAAGVSFDPADRPEAEPLAERGVGLARALAGAFVVTLLTLAWVLLRRDYYGLPLAARPASPAHALLRPAGAVGLAFGIGAVVLILTNLAYLLRRSPRVRFSWGSLQVWMTSHLVTGLGAFLLTLLHAGMSPRDTSGGHAFVSLLVLVVSGAIGRYFYAFVPRAANGRELALEDVRLELANLLGGWERTNRDFGKRVRERVEALVAAGDWTGGFFRRLVALLRSQGLLRAELHAIAQEGRRVGVPSVELFSLLRLARRAHRTALMAAHYEDVRGLLASWRWLHRWMAVLMLFCLGLHVFTALRYADLLGTGG